MIESDDPREGRQPPMKPVHRRFCLDRVDRDERTWHGKQVDGAIAQDLIRDIDVATVGVTSARSLRHSLEASAADDTIETCRAIVLWLMRVPP
jgi:hypothetical protein